MSLMADTFKHPPLYAVEPALARAPNTDKSSRWRWWYSAIADRMISHPEWTQEQIAQDLQKNPNTISAIINTDIFREYLARRKAEWRQDHDLALRSKLHNVAAESLDIMLDKLKTQRTQIPIQMVEKVMSSSLEKLGYGVEAAPTVVVDNRQQTVQVSGLRPEDLEAARQAMRAVEASKAGSSLAPPATPASLEGLLEDVEVEDVTEGGDSQ